MTATILDGRAIAAAIADEVRAEVAALTSSGGVTPGITVLQAGADPASAQYVRQIKRSFERAGMGFTHLELPATTTTAEVVETLKRLGAETTVAGVMVQLPLPATIDTNTVIQAVPVDKDVDGVNPLNAGLLWSGSKSAFAPATPSGGLEILHRSGIALAGRHAVVVGRSNIVGKPMAALLLAEHATVTICHSRTADLGAVTRQADVLCLAVGRANLITGEMVKPGAVVIDFGVNFIENRSVGDADFASVSAVASAITPVPGGTGPVTNAILLRNTLIAAQASRA